MGFQYQYDPKTGQFAHATAIMVLTPEGKIAQYYYGVEYAPKDLRLGLVQASHEQDRQRGGPGAAVLLPLRSGDREIWRRGQRGCCGWRDWRPLCSWAACC